MMTEFGKIREDQHGYYIISTNEKGFAGKKLHRLIYCKHNNCTLEDIEGLDIHHIDNDKHNNEPDNLVAISHGLHSHLHNKNKTVPKEVRLKMSESRKGKKHSEETKRKMSLTRQGRPLSDYHIMRLRESHIGLKHSEETKRQMSIDRKGKKLTTQHKKELSKSTNTTGFFRVSKQKKKSCKQGFYYVYSYHDEGKRRKIASIDINNLKDKVVSKGLEWYEFDNEKNEGGVVL